MYEYDEHDVWHTSRTELDDNKIFYYFVTGLFFLIVIAATALTLITYRQQIEVRVSRFYWSYMAQEQWWEQEYEASCKCRRYDWRNRLQHWTRGEGRDPFFWSSPVPLDPAKKRLVIGSTNHYVDAIRMKDGKTYTANLPSLDYWRTLNVEQKMYYYLDIRGVVVDTSETAREYTFFLGRQVNAWAFLRFLVIAAFATVIFAKMVLFREEVHAVVTGHSWVYKTCEQRYESRYSPARKMSVTQWWDEAVWSSRGDNKTPSYPNRKPIPGRVRYVKYGTDHLLHCKVVGKNGRVLKPDILDYPEGQLPPLWRDARDGDIVILKLGFFNNVHTVKLLRRDANYKLKRSWF